MEDKEKKKRDRKKAAGARENEKVSRREAMKRMAKGIALVGTLGVTAVVTQGEYNACYYANIYGNLFYDDYNYSDYSNYSDTYSNYSNAYSDAYTDTYKPHTTIYLNN